MVFMVDWAEAPTDGSLKFMDHSPHIEDLENNIP